MSGRGRENTPNTRQPKRPPRKPSRLDQFSARVRDEARAGDPEEIAEELGIADKADSKHMRAPQEQENVPTGKKKYRAEIYRT